MIVGHKIEQWATVEPRDYGGHFEVITHRRVTELHATKGWRVVRHTQHVQRVRNAPTHLARSKATFAIFDRANRPGPISDPAPYVEYPLSERAMMRHGWYRRKLRRFEATGIPINHP